MSKMRGHSSDVNLIAPDIDNSLELPMMKLGLEKHHSEMPAASRKNISDHSPTHTVKSILKNKNESDYHMS